MINEQFLIRTRDLMLQIKSLDRKKIFDMRSFGGISDQCVDLDSAVKCGAVACAVGWAYSCLEPLGSDEDPGEYFDRMYFTETPADEESEIMFDWLFSGDWAFEDGGDGPEHVALRINWLLANGLAVLMARQEDDYDWMATIWGEICSTQNS